MSVYDKWNAAQSMTTCWIQASELHRDEANTIHAAGRAKDKPTPPTHKHQQTHTAFSLVLD